MEQATDNNMAHARCMLDTWGYKYTHSSCVIVIVFPQKQWLYERVSLLRYTYIACLKVIFFSYFHTESYYTTIKT